MPSCLIDEEHGECAWRHLGGDFGQVQVHRLDIADRQDKPCAFALFGADGAEDVGRCGSLIPRRARASAALGPPAGDLVLLADASLVREPDFYLVAVERFLTGNCIQAGGETFLKSSITPSACA